MVRAANDFRKKEGIFVLIFAIFMAYIVKKYYLFFHGGGTIRVILQPKQEA